MQKTKYYPRKEICLFLLIWPLSAVLLCILTTSVPYFHHFIEKWIELWRSDTTTGLGALIQYIFVLPIFALAETVLWSLGFDDGSGNLLSNPLVQVSEYFLMLGWVVALAVFYTRYYKSCSKEQLKKMRHPTLFYFTPIIIIAVCALFAGLINF